MNSLPNFFIGGAPKTGTTSFHNYLDQHPSIFMSPIKEPHYFSKDIRCKNFDSRFKIQDCFDIKEYLSHDPLPSKHAAFCIEEEEDYLALFKGVSSEKIIGESSVFYLWSHDAAEEIFKFNPDAKLVFFLRNPVERAFSHWLMDFRDGRAMRATFSEAVKQDQEVAKRQWGNSFLYLELGLYSRQLAKYFELFPKDQIKIILFDDVKRNTQQILDEIFDFLQVERMSIDTEKKYNETKSVMRYSIFAKARKNKFYKKILGVIPINLKELIKEKFLLTHNIPMLSSSDKIKFFPYFKEDIEHLEKMIDRDLSTWKIV
ncbi:sulfotransferase [Sulfurimonas diazotrophicus]|uniref:Sulfotransferase n=1 Tax=Sulfurimonas diazotrophicus TaxID=3131939 RepID=A0ABZ3HAT5_9BACT